MTRNFLTAAAILVAFATPAVARDAAAEQSFTRDGQTYVYTKVATADHIVLSGRRYPSGSAFELVVRGDRITGVSGGVPVAFTVRDAQKKLTPTALASR
ncbi:MAG: hypothetical protein JWN66_88 [Sphingomonas bacterium]|uniref:hypothetical protein n=1 Tax=Sphingomonas bacterium TaxID=1895847 RepID=UPI00262D0310|nr:hypothetical protein [Sphingomonas bacterium]MDB5702972.1 hypothetical protein [Sphingomonas bacterium]